MDEALWITKTQISDPAPTTIDAAIINSGHVQTRLLNNEVILSAGSAFFKTPMICISNSSKTLM